MTPPKLYKYCPINANSLRGILRAQVHHSSPIDFNDPLDCNPSLELDAQASELVELLRTMLASSGMDAEKVRREIDRIAYFATDIEGDGGGEAYDRSFSYQLGEEIKRNLRIELGSKGVLSLSEIWSEPLLWSHYADQHQGICIEYDTTGWHQENLRAVNYNASRSIRANDIKNWKCLNDARAERRVLETYFYAKAPQWSYEREWRDVSVKSGLETAHMDLTAIHFGMRVDPVWKWMLTKTLHMNREVTLYDVVADERTFALHRYEMDRDEIERRRIAEPAFRVFGRFVGDDELAAMSVGERAVHGPVAKE